MFEKGDLVRIKFHVKTKLDRNGVYVVEYVSGGLVKLSGYLQFFKESDLINYFG